MTSNQSHIESSGYPDHLALSGHFVLPQARCITTTAYLKNAIHFRQQRGRSIHTLGVPCCTARHGSGGRCDRWKTVKPTRINANESIEQLNNNHSGPQVEDLASRIEKMPNALSAKQLYPLLNFSRTTIYEKVTRGTIPYMKFGTLIRFDPVQVAAWLREHEVVSTETDGPDKRAA